MPSLTRGVPASFRAAVPPGDDVFKHHSTGGRRGRFPGRARLGFDATHTPHCRCAGLTRTTEATVFQRPKRVALIVVAAAGVLAVPAAAVTSSVNDDTLTP
jgi:hypothetical protein